MGSSPDTVLGTCVQTARALLESGSVGEPVAAAAQWSAPDHELRHPEPQFSFQPGAGPLFDVAPHCLTSRVTLLEPVIRVSGVATRSNRERTIASGDQAGAIIAVDVETPVSTILEHTNGVTSTVTVSFEGLASCAPLFEIYGTTGTIALPDSNRFPDPAEIWAVDTPEWTEVPVFVGHADAGHGHGLADLAHAIETDRPHRASGELAFHVLEIVD